MSTNNGDGKPARTLDPETQRAIELWRIHHAELRGDILPHYLLGAVPRRVSKSKGKAIKIRQTRRTYADAVCAMVLAHIIGQVRVLEKHQPWWDGPSYRINRGQLAHDFDCEPDVISKCLGRLLKAGLIGRRREPVHNSEGKPKDWNIYVWPIIPAIVDALKKASKPPEKKKRASLSDDPVNTPLNGAQTPKVNTPLKGVKRCSSTGYREALEGGIETPLKGVTVLMSSEAQQNNTTIPSNVCGVIAPSELAPSALRGAPRPSMQEEPEVSGWETFPGELEEIDVEDTELTPTQKAALVRYHVGVYHRLVFDSAPKLSLDNFEEGLIKVDPTLNWDAADYVLVIVAGWFWSKQGVTEDNGHIQNCWALLCSPDGGKNGLAGLFKTYSTSGRIGIDALRQELAKESGYKLKFAERTLEQVQDWLTGRLEKRGLVKNPNKYYREDGAELYKPEDGWYSIYSNLKEWLKGNDPELKPEKRWLDKVLELYRQGFSEGDLYEDKYAIVGQALTNLKLLPGKKTSINWK